MGLSLSGLASGMDTDSVISQLMSIESAGKTRLQGQEWAAEARKSNVDKIASQLRTLKGSIDDLRSIGSWLNTQTVSSTDSNTIGATYKSGAAVGSYQIAVTQLARADQRFYNLPTPPAADTTMTVGYAGDATSNVQITVKAGATVDDIAASVNANASSPAYAAVVNGQLVLSGKKTGVDLNVTSGDLTEDATKHRGSRMAQWSIDGVAQPDSASNTVTGLPGIELTFKSLTTNPVTINVGAPGPDQSAFQAKVKTFVDTYNATIDMVNSALNEQKVQSPTTQDDWSKGTLRGDPGLQSILSSMRNAMSSTFSGDPLAPNPTAYDQLSDIGIGVPAAQISGAVTQDRLDGKLVIDTTKLTTALTADPTAVRRMLGGLGTTSGFTQALDALIDPIANAGTGTLTVRSQQSDTEIARIKQDMSDMDMRLKMKQDLLKAQFTAMETALSQSQSMQSWLTGQIGQLS